MIIDGVVYVKVEGKEDGDSMAILAEEDLSDAPE
ncbi:hypothetical protein SEA_VROOMVROOM_8 [Arthrobacter phage VroomVroom]|uniref:Uncharacterized protein n=1 Tax=Arthrobacter phage VroomVroom TaxID=3049371 RepID=A0AA49IUK0_9CAUD|nr:hypothetical protein SEA_VROOMVROOM_8 [Arthrobacter phage VroomVroom]